jgi:tetratricopeptide (TPR) repeat protein
MGLGIFLFQGSLAQASPEMEPLRRARARRLEFQARRVRPTGKGAARRNALRREPLLRKALALRQQDDGEWSIPAARVLSRLAENAWDRGERDEAHAYLTRSYEIFKALKGSDDSEAVALEARLGESYRRRHQAGRAGFRLRDAWHASQAATGPYSEGPLPEYQALRAERIGTTYYRRGSYRRAEPYFQRVIKLWEPILGPDHPRVLRARWRLAKIAQKLTRVPENPRTNQEFHDRLNRLTWVTARRN